MTRPERCNREIDWPAVEADYRAGTLSLREMAEKHDCSHSANSELCWPQRLAPAHRDKTTGSSEDFRMDLPAHLPMVMLTLAGGASVLLFTRERAAPQLPRVVAESAARLGVACTG